MSLALTRDNKEVINVQADGSCSKKARIFDNDSNYTFDATETEPPNTNSFFGSGGYSIWAADTTQQKVRGCITDLVRPRLRHHQMPGHDLPVMRDPRSEAMRRTRPARLCRSWLFLEGANEAVLQNAARSGADVLIQELEDFTPPALRPKARALAVDLYAAWREAGVVVAVRVNPLDQDGMDDLAAVMRGRPDIVALPKVAEPSHIARLDEAVARFERDYGIAEGSTALLPNIEYARGLIQLQTIARVSKRTDACLLAAEDLAADLGAERAPDGLELAYCRQRFLVECVAVRRGRGRLPLYLERSRRRRARHALGAPARLWRAEPGRSRACRADQSPADAQRRGTAPRARNRRGFRTPPARKARRASSTRDRCSRSPLMPTRSA